MITIPCGFRFDPSDDELIEGFLLPKLMMRSLPWDGILERDVYSEAPWKVFGELDESSPFWQKPKRVENSKVCKVSVYVFTKLKKASANSNAKKISRTAGCGTWDGQTGATVVKDLAGNVIGSTGSFRFKIPKSKASSLDIDSIGKWTMHEYIAEGANDDDFVLCKITKSTSANGGGAPPSDQIAVAANEYAKERGCDDVLEIDHTWLEDLLLNYNDGDSDVHENDNEQFSMSAVGGAPSCSQIPVAAESGNKRCAEEEKGDANQKKKQKLCNENDNSDDHVLSTSANGCASLTCDQIEVAAGSDDLFWDFEELNWNDEVSDDMFDIDELLNCINKGL